MEFLKSPAFPAVALCIFLPLPLSFAHPASSDDRPFWTERSSYVLREDLYAVGIASRVSTIEEGRQKAFNHGVGEIRNFAQTVVLSGLVIETQMVFEELNPDGTFNVYRLLRVSLPKLLDIMNDDEHESWVSPRMRETMKRLRALSRSQMPRKF